MPRFTVALLSSCTRAEMLRRRSVSRNCSRKEHILTFCPRERSIPSRVWSLCNFHCSRSSYTGKRLPSWASVWIPMDNDIWSIYIFLTFVGLINWIFSNNYKLTRNFLNRFFVYECWVIITLSCERDTNEWVEVVSIFYFMSLRILLKFFHKLTVFSTAVFSCFEEATRIDAGRLSGP